MRYAAAAAAAAGLRGAAEADAAAHAAAIMGGRQQAPARLRLLQPRANRRFAERRAAGLWGVRCAAQSAAGWVGSCAVATAVRERDDWDGRKVSAGACGPRRRRRCSAPKGAKSRTPLRLLWLCGQLVDVY